MSDAAGFTYNPGAAGVGQAPTQLFAWQVCLAHMDEGVLEDADNYADYAINRDRIVQTLGIGMASGQNAFPLDGQLFVVAVSIQDHGEVRVIDSGYPGYLFHLCMPLGPTPGTAWILSHATPDGRPAFRSAPQSPAPSPDFADALQWPDRGLTTAVHDRCRRRAHPLFDPCGAIGSPMGLKERERIIQ